MSNRNSLYNVLNAFIYTMQYNLSQSKSMFNASHA